MNEIKLPPLPHLPLNDPAAAYKAVHDYGQQCARAAIEAALQSQDREDASAEVDAAMESVRNQFCALPRYSFITRKAGVSRVFDRTGNWIEFDQAHALFDPTNVDHARRIEGEGK